MELCHSIYQSLMHNLFVFGWMKVDLQSAIMTIRQVVKQTTMPFKLWDYCFPLFISCLSFGNLTNGQINFKKTHLQGFIISINFSKDSFQKEFLEIILYSTSTNLKYTPIIQQIQQNFVKQFFKDNIDKLFIFKFMSEDIDYQPDVLKFKQVWAENKDPYQTGVDPKNLETIQSNKKKAKNKQSSVNKKRQPVQQNQRIVQKTQMTRNNNQKQQQNNKGTRKAIPNVAQNQRSKQTLRNPKPNHDQVIQITTKPNLYYANTSSVQKQQIAQNHMAVDTKKSKVQFLDQFQLKKLFQQKDYELSMLRVTNQRTQDKVRYLEKQLDSKNQIIAKLRERERNVLAKNSDLQSKEFNFDYGKAEYENFRNDSRRLLKMLQATEQYNDFAKFALDDDGVRFLHNVNKNTKTKIDSSPKSTKSIHFCTCNKQFIPENGFWVPDKVYSLGKQFIRQRKGQITQPQFQLLLYQLNRIWRQRQKRIINSCLALKAHQVGKYKRKLQNLSVQKQLRAKSIKQNTLDHQQ